jgi:hypothetical protein
MVVASTNIVKYYITIHYKQPITIGFGFGSVDGSSAPDPEALHGT